MRAKRPAVQEAALVLLATGLLLLLPLCAMRWTDEVRWDGADFAAAGVLLGGTGMLYVGLSRLVRTASQRRWIGLALALGLALVWIELAVGIIGD